MWNIVPYGQEDKTQTRIVTALPDEEFSVIYEAKREGL